jgi:NTE family protein
MTGILISARPRSWGPRYIQFGGQYSNNLDGSDALNLRFGYLVAPRGPAADEWRTVLSLGEDSGLFTEYYRPFRPDSDFYYSLAAFGGRVRYNTFANSELVSQSNIERVGASVRLGRQLGNPGVTYLGYRRYTGHQEGIIGPQPDGRVDIEGGEIFWNTIYDTLDNVDFPQSGFYANLEALRSDEDLGALSEFDQYSIDYYGSISSAGLTFTGGIRLQRTTSGVAPLQNRFRLGGLFELGGFNDNEITSQNVLLVRAAISRRLGTSLGADLWAGGMIQYFNPIEETDEFNSDEGIFGASLYVGWDTIIGPFHFGYGVSEHGRNSLHILLGRQF